MLTHRPLKVEKGEVGNSDVTFITDEDTFAKMCKGEIKATSAFMEGKVKIKGNIGIAMKAEKLFGRVRSKL